MINNKSRSRAFLLVLPVTLALSAAETCAQPTPVPAEGGEIQLRVIAGEYFFKPARLTVKVNQPVRIVVSREAGIVPHNLVIDASTAGVNIKEDLSTEPKSITFTPTAVGVYAIYCDKKLPFFASHRERGMEGVLEVVP